MSIHDSSSQERLNVPFLYPEAGRRFSDRGAYGRENRLSQATYFTKFTNISASIQNQRKYTDATEFTYKSGQFQQVDGLERVTRPPIFGGVLKEYLRRLPFYFDDWADGANTKTISSGLFMFFETFASTVALAVACKRATGGRFDVTEFLMANAIAGIFDSLVGCQPFVVFRPTGPATQLVIQLYVIYQALPPGTDFFTWYAWVGLFAGIYLLIIAAFELSRYITYLTRYTHDLFAVFACTVYAEEGIIGVADAFKTQPFDEALWGLFLTLITVLLALYWNDAKTFTVFSEHWREIWVEYALILAVIVCVITSYVTSAVIVHRVDIPDSVVPSFSHDILQGEEISSVPRSWAAHYSDASYVVVLLAAFTALPVVFFFFIAQNITAVLFQAPDMQLKKGSYYHSIFLMTAIITTIFSGFGLPFCISSLPHPIQFVRASADLDADGNINKVYENRLGPLMMFILIGVPLFIPQIIRVIPEASVNGILIFIGVAGLLYGNQFFNRVFLLLTSPAEFPQGPAVPYTSVKPSRMHLFTLIQMSLLGICWAVNVSPAGVAFPFVLVCVVPFRNKILPKIFTENELKLLDCDGTEDLDVLLSKEIEHPRTDSVRFQPTTVVGGGTSFATGIQEEVEPQSPVGGGPLRLNSAGSRHSQHSSSNTKRGTSTGSFNVQSQS